MPGYKVVLQEGELREGLTCAYCKLVLKDPVQTSETGLRLCKECFEVASKDPSHSSELGLETNDQCWPDFAVKKEIANLKVKCENYTFGCDWKGLFKQLAQHSQECQYVTVECINPGCGQQLLKANMELHLKEKCLQRRVNCKNCKKEMSFIDLQSHGEVCPNAPTTCKNCKKKMPASELVHHMINECKHVKCVCKSDKSYEAGSPEFRGHLHDAKKLGDHLMPIICEFTKMTEGFKEMTMAYQQATKRIDTLEKDRQKDAQRIKVLEKHCQEDTLKMEAVKERNNELEERSKEAGKKIDAMKKKYENLEKIIVALEEKNSHLERVNESLRQDISSVALTSKGPSFNEVNFQQMEQQINHRLGSLEKRWTNISNEIKDICTSNSQLTDEIDNLKHQYTVSVPASKMSAFGGEMVPYEKPSSDVVKQVEEKVLEVERTLNVISVHHSELELQLQASLASTHNGAFLWRIPEVRRRTRDAKIGRITSIYSPPFYTGRNGYKMCIRAYLNGDGTGEGTHISIFFVLMKGEYDPLLQWPFESKISLILVDQDHMKHLVQTFKPNAQSSSFQKPKTDMNVASGCPEFADLSILDNTSYVKDDVMYIKAIVDTSKIFHP